MDLFHITIKGVVGFLLILCRVGGIFLVAPVFSSGNIPPQLKIGFALILSMLLLPTVSISGVPMDAWGILGSVMREVLMGVILGTIVYFVFLGIQLAGQVVDIQIGFGIANVIDPMSSAQISIVGQFQYLIALLIFLGVDAHHHLIRAMASSFNAVPLGGLNLQPHLFESLFGLSGRFFLIALQIGGPVILVLLLSNLTLGIIARTIPQMNVLVVGLPVNTIVGLATVYFTFFFFSAMFQSLLSQMWGDLNLILQRMR